MHRQRIRTALATVLCGLLAACGGSGSTGLFPHLEGALLEEVRETGECLEANETLYCPATPADERDPFAPGLPEPCDAAECLEGDALFVFEVPPLAPGAACAAATRTAERAWALGDLEPVTADDRAFAAIATRDVSLANDTVDVVLLCFDDPPAGLPGTVETLADTAPSIILVAPALG